MTVAGGEGTIMTADRLRQIDDQIRRTSDAVRADPGASPVLIAVIEEFERKSRKAIDALGADPDNRLVREHVVEVEQAADSAKAAATADPGAAAASREAVVAAHDSICVLKCET